MRRLVLISGRPYAGTTALAKALAEEFGYQVISTTAEQEGQRNLAGVEPNVVEHVRNELRKLPVTTDVVVDGVYTRDSLDGFRRYSAVAFHVHLLASDATLVERRSEQGGLYPATESQRRDLTAAEVEYFRRDADVLINADKSDTTDALVQLAARLGLYSAPSMRCVDVVIGGQYGSEGKGHVAAYLARDYDVLVRVGGPNAGHSVASASGVYIYHHLPSGCRDTDSELLLGPGMTINVSDLLKEIGECEVGPERLFIDPQVMVIEPQDVEAEKSLVASIASTGRGGGAAAARRIMGRRPDAVRLARDVTALAPFVGASPAFRGATMRRLEKAYRSGQSILLEGTQGSGLSLYHGQYPFVTSRDTNVAGCLAEAGISPTRVRRVLMVVRPTPIRVSDPDGGTGSSGPLKYPTSFDEVARQAGLVPEEISKAEITSTTKRNRRVGWFEWEQFRRACALNAPTDLVLTFADYIDADNVNARRFDQLSEKTIRFIEELERVAHAPVSLINTRFPRDASESIDLRTVIDRRDWHTRRVGR